MNAFGQDMVLVPFDLSRQGVQAVWRAAIVARDLGASVRLLHVPRLGGAPHEERELRRLAAEVGGHTRVPFDLRTEPGEALAAIVRAARDAALVVIGSGRRNALRELLLGTQAERLIRLCRVPVLVVKAPPGGSYRRVLAPVELGPAARPVIAAASRVARDSRFEVLHAVRLEDEVSMRAYDVPQWVIRRHRDRAAQRARLQLQELIVQSAARATAPQPVVGFGDAAALALTRERALCADLLVVGKRTRGLLADFFLGSVTQRLLAESRADVLVLPVAGKADTREGTMVLDPA